MTRVLVVGARRGSLGHAIKHQAMGRAYRVTTAGIYDEEVTMDVVADDMASLTGALASIAPDHVVCTVGVNQPEPADAYTDVTEWYDWHFRVNVIGPMRLLAAWTAVLREAGEMGENHYVAISSNSARVPRSFSAAYCASKAALSQALRVKAREGVGQPLAPLVYGYEPGLLAGTPMTADTITAFGPDRLTRMRDTRLAQGMPPASLAWMVVSNLKLGPEVNGCLFRLDADEA